MKIAAAWSVIGFGLLLAFLAYAPGLMPPDAQDQLRQAQTGRYVDWHPPIMAWLWAQTNRITPGPEGLFLVLIALYWGGFFLIIRYASQLSSGRQLATSILPFSPFLFNFAGTIWKDVLVFDCYLVALGIALLWPLSGRYTALSIASISRMASGFVLLIIGSLARYNSVLAAVPLVVMFIWPRLPVSRPLAAIVRRIVVCTPFVLMIWGASADLVNSKLLHAKKVGIENSLFVWDLDGISHQIGQNLLPGTWSKSESEEIVNECYTPATANPLFLDRCKFVHDNLESLNDWRSSLLLPVWIEAIVDHPEAYFIIRSEFLRTLFWPNNIFVFDADAMPVYGSHDSLSFQAAKKVLMFCKSAPVIHYVFTVGFWMLISAVLCVAFSVAIVRGNHRHYKSLLLSLSAAGYVWPLLVIGVAGDLRYAYWSIAATCIALVIGGTDEACSLRAIPEDPHRSSTLPADEAFLSE